MGWIAVDLDGTLAEHRKFGKTGGEIGPPVPLMVARVKKWLDEGKEVRIFTARVAPGGDPGQTQRIQDWLAIHLGWGLPVTCMKDRGCLEVWDDRAMRVERDTGRVAVLMEGLGETEDDKPEDRYTVTGPDAGDYYRWEVADHD